MKKQMIGFIGAGNMAQAILNGLVKSPLAKDRGFAVFDIDEALLGKVSKKYGCKPVRSAAEIVRECRVVVLAVKPQNFADLLPCIAGGFTAGHLIISIAAGISIGKIQSLLGKKTAVVRVMPNTPALIGEAAAGYSFSGQVKPADRKLAAEILASFCAEAIAMPEERINTVTALSGSGPAYVFYFAEAMMKAAAELGFPPEDAKKLILQTFKGSASLMAGSDETPEVLRARVTSKGGTTEQAVRLMEEAGVGESIRLAVKAAKKRADELGK